MKIEITNEEATTVIGALSLLSKMEKDEFGLKKLSNKIAKQTVNKMKKEYKDGN